MSKKKFSRETREAWARRDRERIARERIAAARDARARRAERASEAIDLYRAEKAKREAAGIVLAGSSGRHPVNVKRSNVMRSVSFGIAL